MTPRISHLLRQRIALTVARDQAPSKAEAGAYRAELRGNHHSLWLCGYGAAEAETLNTGEAA